MFWLTTEGFVAVRWIFRQNFALVIAVLAMFPLLTGCAGATKTSRPPPPVPHSATLSWNAGTSVVVGYNVYRSEVSGGPYIKLNSTPISGTTYADTLVQSNHTYFYVVTAVDANGGESVYSNEASAAIP